LDIKGHTTSWAGELLYKIGNNYRYDLTHSGISSTCQMTIQQGLTIGAQTGHRPILLDHPHTHILRVSTLSYPYHQMHYSSSPEGLSHTVASRYWPTRMMVAIKSKSK
jgi:hypothetical protein